ncbi:glycosyltransferase [Lyngbya confervoides]|uniref:Glycosyltransferase family 2 protein n=1 Tax=Lyngbya confervoides BDU141951 TaxID=1574623 RepID=A0ABD4T0T4_9CYAN|nr:glycosyltransferase [Lyngbya confervoides]MCM1982386.1 glycosyltransferase family 2 protein [Lyngbya confervoides BDU141951]
MEVSVVVPTYRRTDYLEKCLDALKQQLKPAKQVIVTVRETDQETWAFLDRYPRGSLPLDLVCVEVPGVIAALDRGFSRASGEIIAMIDDDAQAFPDWIQRLEVHYQSNPRIGAVGGKDWIYDNGEPQPGNPQPVVGRLQWFGRPIGNHSLGFGEAREVDILKGVNMSFRKQAIGDLTFDPRLLGTGAQVHFEMSFCLALKRAGWRIIYDPNIAVNHYRAQRYDEDQRHTFIAEADYNQVYNETLAVLDHLWMPQRFAFLLWAVLIGTRSARGVVQTLRFLPQEQQWAIARLQSSLRGRWDAWRAWHRDPQTPTGATIYQG